MTSVDDLFRKPNAPPKRKLEDPTTSLLQYDRQQSRKAKKLYNGSSPQNQADTVGGAYNQQGEAEDDGEDVEAGPSLPPGDDDDVEEDVEDDEEGRFFGGGVNKQGREVLDFVEQNGVDEVEEKIDLSWLKRTAISFERSINKNAELRAKYEDDPIKFVASEADLDGEIKAWSLMSEQPDLYKDFVRTGCAKSLVGLLAHDNTDIAISVCQLLGEMTSEDTAAQEEQWKTLVDALLKADIIDLLVSNLSRLDEANESDREGVYYVLNLIENLLSETRVVDGLGKNAMMMEWLRGRIQNPDAGMRAGVGQNRQYAAEILSIILQGNTQNRSQFADAEGIDALLQLLSAYRRRDPEKDSDEEEFVENLFDCLVSVVKEAKGADRFIAGEGVELCLIMLREGKLSRIRALKVLDHAIGGPRSANVGVQFVEAAGLKTLFSMFMKSKRQDRESTEHMIGIFASLLRYLPAESAARIRTLAKFVEKDYEKLTRLLQLRNEIAAKLKAVDNEINKEKSGLSSENAASMESEWLSRRFDAGLFSVQTLDTVLAWLVAEDDGARRKVRDLMHADGSYSFEVMRQSLTEQLQGVDLEEGKDTKDMLETLLQFLA